jgi:uncharacterized protein
LTAFHPGRVTIDGYGNGGFRFANMSHRGSILVTASGIHDWRPRSVADITTDDLVLLGEEKEPVDLFILGSGRQMEMLPKSIRSMLTDICSSLEVMSTGAAVTTYNILLAEGRRVSAGLIAVDETR